MGVEIKSCLVLSCSGQQQQGKWQEISCSLDYAVSFWYITSPVFPFLLLPSVFKGSMGLDKTSLPLQKLLLFLPRLRSTSPLLLT